VKLADPLDRALALVRKDVNPEQSRGARVLEAAMAREAGGIDPLVERVARIVFSYDQDFVDRCWSRIGPIARQTFYEIAEAVIAEVRAA